jgi:hypothetical protein
MMQHASFTILPLALWIINQPLSSSTKSDT